MLIFTSQLSIIIMKSTKLLTSISLILTSLCVLCISIALEVSNPLQDILAWTTVGFGVLALISFILLVIAYIREKLNTKK